MRQILVALFAGSLFGAGLAFSIFSVTGTRPLPLSWAAR